MGRRPAQPRPAVPDPLTGYRASNGTADRALQVLSLLGATRASITAGDVARELGVGRSTAYRYVKGLLEAGFLAPEPGGAFSVGPRVVELAEVARRSSGIGAVAQPAMTRLRDETGETVLLAVLETDRLVVREAVESREVVRMTMPAGGELPVPGSAAARAIAAHLPPAELARLRQAHPGFDDDRALATVRRRGWGANDREVHEGVRAVAAPLLADGGYPVGAFVVCGPTTRVTPAVMRRHGRLAADIAATALTSG
jgi:DNA-binding IclR family transcriptional regulator